MYEGEVETHSVGAPHGTKGRSESYFYYLMPSETFCSKNVNIWTIHTSLSVKLHVILKGKYLLKKYYRVMVSHSSLPDSMNSHYWAW